MKKIRFCEPYVSANDSTSGVDFEVTDEFFELLQKEPKHFADRCANAYMFGREFPKLLYKKLGSHSNDGAQTGLIDITSEHPRLLQNELDNIVERDNDWCEAYNNYDLQWDNRAALDEIRKLSRRILFVGETVGGDVGADLYVYYDPRTITKENPQGDIVSLVIDNNCIFENESREDETEL